MAIGVRPLLEERIEQQFRESELDRGKTPSITVVATADGLVAQGDTPRPIPVIPYHLAQMTRIEAMDLTQW